MTTNNKANRSPNADERMLTVERPPAATNCSTGDIDCAERRSLADFPALASLRLAAGDLHELSHQGFVRQESRGDLVFFKLRFRRGNRQVVRYVGGAGRATAIRTELARLQADCRLERELGRLEMSARRMLRDGKRTLEPIVAAENLRFHGLSLRQPRKPKHRT